MPDTLKLSLTGMHCGSCVQRVTNALKTIPGVQVQSVEVGSARVTFSPGEASPQDIVAAVNRIGFPTTIEQ